jgi:hypothetical protein
MIKLTLQNSTLLNEVTFIVNQNLHTVRKNLPVSLELDKVEFVGVEAKECDGDFMVYNLSKDINFRCTQLGNKLRIAF